MSTTTGRPTTAAPQVPAHSRSQPEGSSRVLLAGVGWGLFRAICESRADRPVPRVNYDAGELELTSPSSLHEVLTDRCSLFVVMLARGLGMPLRGARSTRWEREDLVKAKEPDACFYLANEHRVRGLKEIDLAVLPPPDLAIEIVLTNPLLDALRIYGALGVPEVWTFDGQAMRFLLLQADGTYAEADRSRSFPRLRAWEVAGWMSRADAIGDMAWSIEVEAWARDELARRDLGAP